LKILHRPAAADRRLVLTTPLLRALRRRYPDAQLTYLVEPAAVPVVRGNRNLANIVVVPKRRGLARVRDDISMARQLRRQRFDVAIDLHGGPRAAWFTWASGAPMRIGYAIKGRAWMYTHVIGRTPDEAPRASVANQWDLLAPLDVGPPDPARDPLEMAEDPQAVASVERRLREARITPRIRSWSSTSARAIRSAAGRASRSRRWSWRSRNAMRRGASS
jgi:ADP-heptose:LPS heptosyltransferase